VILKEWTEVRVRGDALRGDDLPRDRKQFVLGGVAADERESG